MVVTRSFSMRLHCRQEDKLVARLHNDAGVPVTVLPYKAGSVLPQDTVRLNNGESFRVGFGSSYGDVRTPFFETEILAIGENDSIVVVFDFDFRVTHYIEAPALKSDKCHLYESDRNIIRRKNYEFEIVDTKGGRTNYHDYYFTSSDFEFARD